MSPEQLDCTLLYKRLRKEKGYAERILQVFVPYRMLTSGHLSSACSRSCSRPVRHGSFDRFDQQDHYRCHGQRHLCAIKESTKPEVHLDFDKRIHADATEADAFTKNEARVIVYYFGNGDTQTAVAFQDLGTGPFEDSSGKVVKFDRRERVLTLMKTSGAEESFHLDPKAVAETPFGAMPGSELDAKDGDQLQVTASSVNGIETALFIRTM
jgi:hypothetical protein